MGSVRAAGAAGAAGAATVAAGATAATARIASLDWVRGWMLVASVATNSLLVMPEWFGHALWNEVHPLDLIFPVFVTLSGCGLAFALHRRVALLPLLRRVLVLVAVGLLYGALAHDEWEPSTFLYTGVLQLYAVLVAVVGLLHLVTRSWIGWAVITVVVAAGYSALLAGWASGCLGGELAPMCNPSGVVDVAVFGAPHIYFQSWMGYDPVGLVAACGALVSAAAGATMGHLLLAVRAGRVSVLRFGSRGVLGAVGPLLAAAAGCVLLGVLAIVVPHWVSGMEPFVMKRLWSPPFALFVAAGVAVALLAGHLLLDRRNVGQGWTGRWLLGASYPLIALGRNSLLVYFGSHVVMGVLSRRVPVVGVGEPPTFAEALADSLAVAGHPQLTWTALALLFWILLACALHRGRIYLRP